MKNINLHKHSFISNVHFNLPSIFWLLFKEECIFIPFCGDIFEEGCRIQKSFGPLLMKKYCLQWNTCYFSLVTQII